MVALTTTVTLGACGNGSDGNQINARECENGSAAEQEAANIAVYSPPAFPGLRAELGTIKFAYSAEDACIPVSVVLINEGVEDVELSTEQAEALSNARIGLYGGGNAGRLFEEDLVRTDGAPVEAGTFLEPGESSILTTVIDRERLALYTVPPLSGGVVHRELDVQGAFVPGFLLPFGISRVDFTVDVNFGDLPDEFAEDPGAGDSFVPGQLLVNFNTGTSLEHAERVIADAGCHIFSPPLFGSFFGVSIPFDRTTGELIEEFEAEPSVQSVYRNAILSVP